MTLRMADSIYPQNLPAGFDAYLAYVDGNFQTYNAVKAMFPGKLVIGLTVTGATLDADGCDIEQLDLTPVGGANWLAQKLATRPSLPPVAYCSVDGMPTIVSDLAGLGVPRASVLLLSAHYWDPADPAGSNYQPHICSPATCNLNELVHDGTQWTDLAPGNGGTSIDSSLLTDNFFGTVGESDMTDYMVKGSGPGIYLLRGEKMHGMLDDNFRAALEADGVKLYNVSDAEITALLADFPAAAPPVTVNVPPVTVTTPPVPTFTIAGTVTPS